MSNIILVDQQNEQISQSSCLFLAVGIQQLVILLPDGTNDTALLVEETVALEQLVERILMVVLVQ